MKYISTLLVLILGIVVATTNSTAQRLSGSARVQVMDPSGAVVPDAKATLVSKDKGTKAEISAGDDGILILPDLAPGNYVLTVEHEGFKTVSTTVTILVGVTSSIPLKLEVGSASTEIEVQGNAITVDTSKSTVQGVIGTKEIDSLPLNGRNFLDLAQLAPGVQIVDGGQFDPTKNQMVGVSIGGRGGRVTRIQADGVDITDETVGTTVMNLTNESIQEFGIAQSSMDVSTDLTSSGAVNIITRSGTNAMHGSGFGLFRRSDFAASTAPLGLINPPKPPFSRDNYGGRLGGPFIKNRWFWEAEYEKITQQGQNTTNVIPFPQFTGSFGVPVDEHMGGIRTDVNITNNLKFFYRFTHDDNIGVTGFGGVGLSAFANSNSTNSHVAGLDFGSGNLVHSVRFSFLKFINGIVDGNALAGTPVQDAAVNVTGLGGFIYGPNANAPQNTYQQNRQIKYDGTLVHGRHTIQFGVEYNRIDQAGFASFFGLGPRVVASFASGVATDPFNSAGAADPLNYKVNTIYVGNGLGALSEKPSLGFPHGGFANNRFGIYLHDNWKATNNFTLNGGLRYDRDDGLSNADLERTPLINSFDPELGGHPRNDNMRLAPQAGFSWNLGGSGRTVIRGGGGIYYDTNIFNNLSFDRQINLPAGFGNAYFPADSGDPLLSPIDGSVLFDFSTQCTGAQPTTGTPNSCWGAPIGAVIPFAVQAEQLFQAQSAQLSNGWPQAGVPPLFNNQLGVGGGAILDPKYRSPYGANINVGIQRQIRPGLVLSVDYVMNRGVHFYQTVDRNRVGAANTLNLAVAQSAMAATFAGAGCNAGSVSANVNCVINAGGTIDDFAGNGLGAGSTLDGFAFGGSNPNFRTMDTIEYNGLSRYSGLQALLTGRIGNVGPLHNLTTNVTYALSRFNSTSTDQDFLFAAVDNDNPDSFYGPSNLDRTHMLGASFVFDLPMNFHFSTSTYYRSREASIGIFVPTGSDSAAEIFESDFNGDGTIGDPLPGTKRGAFGRSVTASTLNNVINKYDTTVAGSPTPAGLALINAGLFTTAQLQALGGVATAVDPAVAGQIDNPNFYTSDIRLSWTYTRERVTIEPMAECFNIFNRMNGVGTGSDGRGGNTALDGTLSDAVGSINGTPFGPPERVGAGSGSFSSGGPRAFQFGIRVTF